MHKHGRRQRSHFTFNISIILVVCGITRIHNGLNMMMLLTLPSCRCNILFLLHLPCLSHLYQPLVHDLLLGLRLVVVSVSFNSEQEFGNYKFNGTIESLVFSKRNVEHGFYFDGLWSLSFRRASASCLLYHSFI